MNLPKNVFLKHNKWKAPVVVQELANPFLGWGV
jgi:hypothetical protein